MKNAILLILANKQDLPEAKSLVEITEALELEKFNNRIWKISSICALQKETVDNAFAWCNETLDKLDSE